MIKKVEDISYYKYMSLYHSQHFTNKEIVNIKSLLSTKWDISFHELVSISPNMPNTWDRKFKEGGDNSINLISLVRYYPRKSMSIYKREDEWFLIKIKVYSLDTIYYLIDGFDSLISFLKENYLII